MPLGRLEVVLVGAKGLENTDFLCKMDPYVILTCTSQEQKSSVAIGAGSTPEWNQTFVFTIYGDVPELYLKIMDKDDFSADDFVGDARIPLEDVFEAGSIPPTSYDVVKDGDFKGEIRVGLTFSPEVVNIRIPKGKASVGTPKPSYSTLANFIPFGML